MYALNVPFLRRWLSDDAVRFVVALALANAPFWLLGQAFFSHRALINLDIAVALLVLLVSPVAGVVLLFIAWAADIVLNQSLAFHFVTPLELLRSLKFASALQLGEFFTRGYALLAVPFLVSGIALLRLAQGRRRIARPACIVGVLMLVDALNGSSMMLRADRWRMPFNIAGSPIATMIALQLRGQLNSPLQSLPIRDTVQALIDIPEWARQHPDRSALLVIVESLGRPRSPAVNEWLSGQLLDGETDGRFEIRSADIPFRGSTTSGELRSLCALAGSYHELDAASGAQCLPARMGRLGWTTIGMHGFSGRMFDRRRWWPTIGLQTADFIDSPRFAGQPRCGSLFKGGCDEQLIAEAVTQLKPGKRFIYLLTLNTHLPIMPVPLHPDLKSICEQSGVNSSSCRLTNSLGNVLSNLRSALVHVDPAPLVVVVGDHAPPFTLNASRDDFRANEVPAFALIPRE